MEKLGYEKVPKRQGDTSARSKHMSTWDQAEKGKNIGDGPSTPLEARKLVRSSKDCTPSEVEAYLENLDNKIKLLEEAHSDIVAKKEEERPKLFSILKRLKIGDKSKTSRREVTDSPTDLLSKINLLENIIQGDPQGYTHEKVEPLILLEK